MKKLFALLFILAIAVGAQACRDAAAQPVMSMAFGTTTTLGVTATVAGASTVGVSNGPVVDSVIWTKGGVAPVLARTAVISGLVDTLVINPRAPIGHSDTVNVKACAVYRGNGNVACSGITTKIFVNADNQVPTTPVISVVDTTKP